MGKHVNTVYKSHFNAPKDLRKILSEDDDINE